MKPEQPQDCYQNREELTRLRILFTFHTMQHCCPNFDRPPVNSDPADPLLRRRLDPLGGGLHAFRIC